MKKLWLDNYDESIGNVDKFWSEKAKRIDWIDQFNIIRTGNFQKGNIKWFEDGKLNVSFNCLDRHIKENANKTAIIWESDDTSISKSITFLELYNQVNIFANVLKKIGVKKYDVVCIYMPMIIESIVAMLSCARIGAIHSVIFAGFSSESIKDRLIDCQSSYIVTVDGFFRGGKKIFLKDKIDHIIKDCSFVKKILIINHINNNINFNNKTDVYFDDLKFTVSSYCKPVVMNSYDSLFILYTSGSTGKPKGIVHTTGGYLVYASFTHQYLFNIQKNDIYWCTADIGWITGHSYVVYGPLSNGTTTVIYEGIPSYPHISRFCQIIDKYKISVLYTAPTLIRLLHSYSNKEIINNYDIHSLRILGTVGEPISKDAWLWYKNIIGNNMCPILDTWWQTETGGIMISPCHNDNQKPGSAMYNCLGISTSIIDISSGKIKNKFKDKSDYGALVVDKPWPGMMKTIYNDKKRYMRDYFNVYPGFYYSGDGAVLDNDNHYWITGRLDDIINISGHRIGTAEIENIINMHPYVNESAIVGIDDYIRGEVIYAFIVLKHDINQNDKLKQDIISFVYNNYGPIAIIKIIQFVDDLPKTRSGKIMRRLLRKIVKFQENDLGDLSTLANPICIKNIIKNRIL